MQDLDPSKFHVMTPQLRKNLIILGAFFVFVVLPVCGFWYYRFAINRPAQGFKETTFEISEGESVTSIAQRLHTASLVNSGFLFKFYSIISGSHVGIQAGVYDIPAGAPITALGEIFQHGTNDVRVTFVEGWRAEEVAKLATQKFSKVDYEKFASLAKEKEGYLFPDTYYFSSEATEEEIISTLTETFDAKTAEILSDENLAESGLTKEEVIIFASIVEREVANPQDRPIVAGILIDRWRNGELIGADATTQYISAIFNVCGNLDSETCPTEQQAMNMEWWPKELTIEDLNLDNAYNTRKVAGLTPTPISSPGLDAINAVINHINTEYNYYLTDSEGVTHYAVTLEEHNANISRHL